MSASLLRDVLALRRENLVAPAPVCRVLGESRLLASGGQIVIATFPRECPEPT
jgi:hypothetical protein